MKIRSDKHGLYIRSRWHSIDKTEPAYRPGFFNGHSHAWDTSQAELKEGDNPPTSHVSGAPFIRIKLKDKVVYWGSHNRQEGDFAEEIN